MRKSLLFLFLAISVVATAAIPSGYYTSANGKNKADLRSALQTIITNGHSVTSYSGLWTAYKSTDINPSTGKIWDIYSNCSFTYSTGQCGTYSSECDCYNREHTNPQSWFNSASPMYSDLFNVYPTDGKVNGMRSNYAYGEVGSASYTSQNGSKLGSSNFSGYSGTVFEPIDEYKGDIARTYFYMVVRYAGLCENWSGDAKVIYSTANYGFTTYAVNLFLKWSREDPVSAKEIARNDAVYGVQNNRNPFIDYPGLEEYIWGNLTSSTFSTDGVPTPLLTSPSSNGTIDFGKVAYQGTDTAGVYIKGANLTDDLTLSLSGANAADFTLPETTVAKADATNGSRVILGFNAQAVGSRSAVLTVSGGGLASPVHVNLAATVTDGFLALPATDVAYNGFTANWTSSANATGYNLNVYTLAGSTNTAVTLLEEDFANAALPSGWSSDSNGYYDLQTSSNVRLGSSKNYGKVTTPGLDLSNPTVITVKSKQFGSDAGAKLWVIAGTNDTITSFVNSTDYQTFTYDIPAKTSSTTLSFFALNGKRVYLDYVKLTTQGTAQTPVSVSGFPASVGNVLSYAVSGLSENTDYYYTVTPEGNSTGISDVVPVHTLLSGVVEIEGQKIWWTRTSTGIILHNLPEGTKVTMTDALGKKVISNVQESSADVRFDLPSKGIYLLRLEQNQVLRNLKVLY